MYPDVKKLLQGYWIILSYLGLKFLLYPCSKVIGLTDLWIKNLELPI